MKKNILMVSTTYFPDLGGAGIVGKIFLNNYIKMVILSLFLWWEKN